MWHSLDLRFLFFYYLFMLPFSFLFSFFMFQFLIPVPPLFSPLFLSMFFGSCVFHLYPTPNLLGTKGLVVVEYPLTTHVMVD
jgi:hypothetical protein